MDIDISALPDVNIHFDDEKCVDYYCGLFNKHVKPSSPSNSAHQGNISLSSKTHSPFDLPQPYLEEPSTTSSPSPGVMTLNAVPETGQLLKHRLQSLKICDIVQRNMSIAALIKFDLLAKMLTDQSGSRFLQKELKESGSKEDVPSMVNYYVDKHRAGVLDLVSVCEDVYGNYIVQLWFTFGDECAQRLLLDSFVNDHFLRLSRSMYGCRVIQRCLKCVTSASLLCSMVRCFDEQSANAKELHDCFICPYTNHVVQAILDVKFECVEIVLFIKRALEKNLALYCEHVFGCRIIQCFIKNYGDLLDVSLLLMNDAHLDLSKLKYGNYVIQCIIDKNQWYSECDRIRQFRYQLIDDVFSVRNLLFLSKNKFGSNVVEKCIKCANRKQKSVLVHTLIKHQQHLIPTMIKHCYANYVIKALLNETSRKNQTVLMKYVKYHCPNIKDSNHSDDNDNKYCKDLIQEMQRIQQSFE